MNERAARRDEFCPCGRPARTVFITDDGDVGYCGRPDGGAQERGRFALRPELALIEARHGWAVWSE